MLKVEQTGGKEKQPSLTGQKGAAPTHAVNNRMFFLPGNPSNLFVGEHCREIKAGLSSYKGENALVFLVGTQCLQTEGCL